MWNIVLIIICHDWLCFCFDAKLKISKKLLLLEYIKYAFNIIFERLEN